MSGDDLTAIEPWIGGLISRLKPGARKALAVKVGRLMRRRRAADIAANRQPDGSAMEKRKPRRAEAKAGRVKRKGKMFPKLGKARAMRVRATPDGAELTFAKGGKVPETHHFGLEGFVGRTRRGQAIRARYPERRLFGFGADDPDAITDLVIDHLSAG